jgi:hypothetical protein
MPLDREAARAALLATTPLRIHLDAVLDALEECVSEPDGILLNRDEADTARACLVFREVMGRNPGTPRVLGLAARLDAYLWPAP